MKSRRRLFSSGHSETGYMYEYPLILVGTAVLLSVILPHLSRTAAQITIVIAAIPVIVSLHYMIITPGWQPGAGRLGRPWNWIVFLISTAAILSGIALFFIGG
ncbi:MAG: hypothetical protein AAB229_01235 [Candidatus Hydrogenedentota bacterium]